LITRFDELPMTKKIRYFGAVLTLGMLAFWGLALRSAAPFLSPSPTPGPKARATALSLEAQAGHSDGILILGILIFIFIAVPIIMRYKDLRSSQ
jgi:hypothetical protein